MDYCFRHCVPLKELMEHVAALLGTNVGRLRQLHISKQWSRQCQFTWHKDDQDVTFECQIGW